MILKKQQNSPLQCFKAYWSLHLQNSSINPLFSALIQNTVTSTAKNSFLLQKVINFIEDYFFKYFVKDG